MRAPVGLSNQKNSIRVDSDSLLLVEGIDEVNLCKAMIRNYVDDGSDIQVIEAGGIARFVDRLRAIRIAIEERSTFRCIGVIRDADDDPKDAFRKVCEQLRYVGYEPPHSHGGFSDASPSVGVFIVPNGEECGAMETLCRWSVEDTPVAQCVELYLRCLEDREVLASKNRDKSFTHAYMAAMSEPLTRVGEGANKGFWKFDSTAFQELLSFVRSVRDTRV